LAAKRTCQEIGCRHRGALQVGAIPPRACIKKDIVAEIYFGTDSDALEAAAAAAAGKGPEEFWILSKKKFKG
jgi:hypothetical protein